MGRFIDLVGLQFSYLKVLNKSAVKSSAGQVRWDCRCACGAHTTVTGQELRTHSTKSCGCMRSVLCAVANTTHGATKGRVRTAEHVTWAGMLSRCNNAADKRYDRYGARGIKVCKRWHKFENFLADMGARPAGLTLERRNNNRGYSKANCYWATRSEQMRNTSRTVLLKVKGVTKCQLDWATELGGTRTLIQQRLARGWSVEKACTTPIK